MMIKDDTVQKHSR